MTAAHGKKIAATGRGQRLTWIAFALLVVMVVTRMTLGVELRQSLSWGPDASGAASVAGPASDIGLDLLCCIPALLVLARRLADPAYGLRWSWSFAALFPLALWMALSAAWSADRFAAAIGAAAFIAAAALLWAAAQLITDWLPFRLVAAAALGLLAVLAVEGAVYRFIDLPSTTQYFQQHKQELLKELNWQPDSFMATQVESNMRSGAMLGFFHSANTYAACTSLLMVVAMGWLAQRLSRDGALPIPARAAPSKGAGPSRARNLPFDPSLLTIALLLAAGLWLLWRSASKAAAATAVAALVLLLLLRPLRPRLAARPSVAYSLGTAAVFLAALAVIGHGLFHGGLPGSSLNFRWWYWTGAMRIFPHHWLTGIGWDNFGLYYLQYRRPIASEDVKDPHNFALKFLVELGVIGAALLLAWLALLWWRLTRPVLPTDLHSPPAPPRRSTVAARLGAPSPSSPRPLPFLITVASIVLALTLACGVDWTTDPAYIAGELLKRVLFFCVFLVASCAVALTSLKDPQPDDRPAPWLLYAVLVGLGLFLVHGLVDFATSESGPLCLFALLAGSALGLRLPAPAPERRPTARAAAIFIAAVALFLAATLFFWGPTVLAGRSAAEADAKLRANHDHPDFDGALALFLDAADHQPLNADYLFRAALAAPHRQSEQLFAAAIAADPRAVPYYLARARRRLADHSAAPDDIWPDYQAAIALDPNNVSLHLAYASALAGFPDFKKQAVEQYQSALDDDARLDPHDIKRLPAEQLAEIRARMRALAP